MQRCCLEAMLRTADWAGCLITYHYGNRGVIQVGIYHASVWTIQSINLWARIVHTALTTKLYLHLATLCFSWTMLTYCNNTSLSRLLAKDCDFVRLS